jgi:class 3 adenylate cyclase
MGTALASTGRGEARLGGSVVRTQPSGQVAFLFTDIEGSTTRWEAYPDEMCDAVATHDTILRSVFDRHGGYVFATTGDGFAVAFRSAAAAAKAARQAADELEAYPWPTPRLIHIRIGIHVGEAHERDGNYFGRAVNRAARIMAAGHGGQILLSAATVAAVADDALVDLGEYRLKDLASPERLYQLGLREFRALRALAVARPGRRVTANSSAAAKRAS